MPFSDIFIVIKWWIVLFIIGITFLPLTNLIFSNFFDKGYIFAKTIGIALISYTVFILGSFKILPFTNSTILFVFIVFLGINIFLFVKVPPLQRWNLLKGSWKIFFFEEILFIGILISWSFIHAHQPEIHGLEKYMDFGFINSILRAEYFPPLDMWLTPFYINYYYFGHLAVGVLTKLSNLPSSITFNLMLSAISALSFVSAFSIGANLLYKLNAIRYTLYAGGLITAFILNFAGNLHTIYLFFEPYQNENPVPFWQLVFSPQTFPNSYWYPNATRFIHNTIHEFPLYSSVVSDLHGHFLDVPFVLLTIAILLSIFLRPKLSTLNFQLSTLLGFILAVMYMTNAWDGIIYFLMAVLVVLYVIFKPKIYPVFKEIKNEKLKIKNSFQIENLKLKIYKWFVYLLIIGIGLFIFSLPFNLNFKPFTSGIGILCVPKFLTDIGKLGPFLFEANHCQHSPLWQLFILYGFFYFFVFSFIIFLFKKKNSKHEYRNSKQYQNSNVKNLKRFGHLNLSQFNLFRISDFGFRILPSDIFILILILLSTLLILIPEFIYVKDIYPAHYRANTMFKLVYQSFIMLSLASGYIIVRLFLNHKSLIINRSYWKLVYWIIGIIGLFLVMIYPYFAVNSYFGDLKKYSGLNGTNYLRALYSDDYEAILWINKNIKGQPVILEAQGDSYTDYARISANTGLPTVLGWTVHEWLWRGTYDIPSPRIEEVKKMYESEDIEETKTLLKKYNVSLVFVGGLERQKYPKLNEEKFKSLGKIIYQKGGTKIFKIYIR